MSAVNFADVLSISYSKNEITKQITLNIPQSPVIITASNPYIKVGHQVRQLPINVLYRNGDFYLPLLFFINVLKDVFPFEIEYDRDELELLLKQEFNNITAVRIEEKENGLLIRIASGEKFSKVDIFTSKSNNWFYVDIYGGRIDTLGTFLVEGIGAKIRGVVPIQLSNETARISFHTVSSFKEIEIFSKENPDEILVSLRTRQNISTDILTELEKEREKWKIDVIVLDPGHGGKDPGAIGRSGLKEKKITLAIANEIKKEIERRLDVNIVMTRKRDVFVPLKQRTDIANKAGGKLFVSIHADSNPSKRLRGHTVYFLGQAKTKEARRVSQFENSVIKFEDALHHYAGISDASFILAANAQNSYNKESQDFASIIDMEMNRSVSNRGYGVRQAGFYVLYGASMPNVLLETAFISNKDDERNLGRSSFYKSIAKTLCNAIIKFKEKHEAEVYSSN